MTTKQLAKFYNCTEKQLIKHIKESKKFICYPKGK